MLACDTLGCKTTIGIEGYSVVIQPLGIGQHNREATIAVVQLCDLCRNHLTRPALVKSAMLEETARTVQGRKYSRRPGASGKRLSLGEEG